jgi:transposase
MPDEDSGDRDHQRDRAGGCRRQRPRVRRGRDMEAWLGPTPRQMTTGGKPRLLGISKRGNRILRKNLIRGARAALPYLVEKETLLGRWARRLLARAHAGGSLRSA